MSKRNKPPNHKIDTFIEDLYVDDGELRRIGYTKTFIETQLKKYFNRKYEVIWEDFTRRIYWHENQIKRLIANGVIINPRTLRSGYEEDTRYWRDTAIRILVQNELYYIRYVDGEWKSMATLEDLSYKGSKKIREHLMIAHEESLHMVDIGAKIKPKLQAKYVIKDIKDLNKIALEFDVEKLREEEEIENEEV